ncbi:MAG: hypothetical protein DPW18_08650 [Chloroflexi bacterium]|nr:hypothetical protein [Chloroflexota bacterium]MDL1941411.1 hypothetical protein [Chloroflexi bacterium CFX2]
MIEEYFLEFENILRDFPNIQSYSLSKKIYNNRQGSISGKIVFENGYFLEFTEVVDTGQANKVKYRYHFMDKQKNLVFRYDNAPHHPQVKSFPHHKHTTRLVRAAKEPTIQNILMEISKRRKK